MIAAIVSEAKGKGGLQGTALDVRLGVVFCGGRSARMGRDKAFLELDGKTLLERAVACLSSVVSEVVLACGSEDRYGHLGLERVLDRAPGAGPLSGLEAALARLMRAAADPERAFLFALACDMPRAEPAVFDLLFRRLQTSSADAALFATDAGLEPLYAVYRGSALPAVERALQRGERRLVAFHDELRVSTLDECEWAGSRARPSPACNVNTPEEFRGLGGEWA